MGSRVGGVIGNFYSRTGLLLNLFYDLLFLTILLAGARAFFFSIFKRVVLFSLLIVIRFIVDELFSLIFRIGPFGEIDFFRCWILFEMLRSAFRKLFLKACVRPDYRSRLGSRIFSSSLYRITTLDLTSLR